MRSPQTGNRFRIAPGHGGTSSARAGADKSHWPFGGLGAYRPMWQRETQNFGKKFRKAAAKRALKTRFANVRASRQDAACELIAKLESYIKALRQTAMTSRKDASLRPLQSAPARAGSAAGVSRAFDNADEVAPQTRIEPMKMMNKGRSSSNRINLSKSFAGAKCSTASGLGKTRWKAMAAKAAMPSKSAAKAAVASARKAQQASSPQAAKAQSRSASASRASSASASPSANARSRSKPAAARTQAKSANAAPKSSRSAAAKRSSSARTAAKSSARSATRAPAKSSARPASAKTSARTPKAAASAKTAVRRTSRAEAMSQSKSRSQSQSSQKRSQPAKAQYASKLNGSASLKQLVRAQAKRTAKSASSRAAKSSRPAKSSAASGKTPGGKQIRMFW